MTKLVFTLRTIDNPDATVGLIVGAIKDGPKPKPKVAYSTEPPKLDEPSRVVVQSNELARIGGLAYFPIKEQTPPRQRTAERFKAEYEAMYGLGDAALDPERIRVDTSACAHDSGMANRIDAGAAIVEAEQFLGRADMHLLVRVLILEQSCRTVAGKGGRAAEHAARHFKAALDRLSGFWGY